MFEQYKLHLLRTMKAVSVMLFVSILIFHTGCATQPSDIPTAHVSPLQYSNYDCDQIAMEMRFVGRRINELYYNLEDEASSDEGQMALGLILFWPALFFLEGGDDFRAGEYARLKGERVALEDSAVMKKCDPASLPRFEEPKPKEIPVKEDVPTM